MKKYRNIYNKDIDLESYTKAKHSALTNFVQNFNMCVKGEFELLPNQFYDGVHGKLKLRHTCGEICEISPANLLSIKDKKIKTSCKKCQYEKIANTQRYTMEDFIKAVSAKFDYIDEYEFLSEYTNTNTKLKIRHLRCNSIINMRPREMLQGNYCSICNSV